MAAHLNTLTMQEAAKIVGIGSKKLFKLLREKKVLNQNNLPYQRYIDNGYLKVDSGSWNHPEVGEKLYAKTIVTVKGVEWIENLIKQQHQVIKNEQPTEHRTAI